MNTSNKYGHLYKLSVLYGLFFALLLCGGCGKRRPPQPPTERIPQRAEIEGFQRGNEIFLEWSIVPRNAADTDVLSIRRADVYRLAEAAASPLSLTEEEFASRSTLIGSVEVPKVLTGNQTRMITYTDKLDLAGKSARLRYAIRFVNANGQPAGFSNFLLITPISNIALAPVFTTLKLEEPAISLKWEKPTANADGSAPPNILGYNIYRQTGKENAKLLTQTPISENNFRDETFKFGEKYTYFIRAVSFGDEAVPVESFDSQRLSAEPKDIFAPKSPEGLTIAAAPNRLALFFVANAEKDLAGYNVFRATVENLPQEQWTKLTPEILTATTFEDQNIESGTKYFYFVTALDQTGNSSRPSEIVSETAP